MNLGSRDGKMCDTEVPATTLDELYEQEPAMREVLSAKLDCEGCEAQALLGGRRFLKESPPCSLAFEVVERFFCESGIELRTLANFLDETWLGIDGGGWAPQRARGVVVPTCTKVARLPFAPGTGSG